MHITGTWLCCLCGSPLTQDGLHGTGTTTSRPSMKHVDTVSDLLKSSDHNRRGSAGVVGSMKLLKSYQSMHAPFTQVFFFSPRVWTIWHSYHMIVINKVQWIKIIYICLLNVIGCSTYDRRHAWRKTAGSWSFWEFFCKLKLFIYPRPFSLVSWLLLWLYPYITYHISHEELCLVNGMINDLI